MPPALTIEQSGFATDAPPRDQLHPEAIEFIAQGADGDYPHIASPDVLVDHQHRQIRLYYHGRMRDGRQRTRVAVSADGVRFESRENILGLPYMRIFQHQGVYYALSMPAQLYRSRDGLSDFETGPRLTEAPIRHHALVNHHGCWYLFWTRVGDDPERILVSVVHTDGDWQSWNLDAPVEIHRARKNWEGADLASQPSVYGAVHQRVNQLRDPAIFVEGKRIFLLYALAGEQGIGIGELIPPEYD